jgi:hypothetical protein
MHDNNGNIRRELRTYKQLDAHYKSWATGHTPKLAIVGRGGIGKCCRRPRSASIRRFRLMARLA